MAASGEGREWGQRPNYKNQNRCHVLQAHSYRQQTPLLLLKHAIICSKRVAKISVDYDIQIFKIMIRHQAVKKLFIYGVNENSNWTTNPS